MAAASQPSKVLRIGIIVDGKIVQERLIKAGDTVTIGEATKNTFVLPKLGLPRQDWPLFVAKGGKYYLQFTENMKGKVGAGGAVTGLEKVRADSSVEREGPAWKVPLTEQDRGKIGIDNVTVLFQFVSAPPTAAMRPPRMDFRPRLVEEDDALLFGFLVLFGSIGAIFVIWARLTTFGEDDEGPVVLDEKWTKLMVQEPPPTPTTEPTEEPGDTKAEEPKEAPKEKPTENPGEQKKAPKSADQARDEVLKKSAVLQFLTTRGDSASGTARDLWGDADAAKVAGSLDGVSGTVAADENNVGRLNGVGGPGGDADIGDIGQIGGDGGNAQLHDAPKVILSVETEDGSADAEAGDPAMVKKTVTRYYGQLKYCYENRLKANPDLAGRVEIEWNVTAGKVTSASVFTNTTGDSELASCITGKIKHWVFPAEFTGDVTWPFIFKQKT
jgi:hypothetical protein